MKKILALVILAASFAFAAVPPVVTVDLYGNVFLDGANTNSQIADFARNNPALAPQVDGAVRDAALAARTHIAAQVKAAQDAAAAQVAAKETEKQAAITAAIEANAAALSAAQARIAQLEAALTAANVAIPAAP